MPLSLKHSAGQVHAVANADDFPKGGSQASCECGWTSEVVGDPNEAHEALDAHRQENAVEDQPSPPMDPATLGNVFDPKAKVPEVAPPAEVNDAGSSA